MKVSLTTGLPLLMLVLTVSCAKCGKPEVVDAGEPWYQPLSTATRERHSTDLRSVLLVIFPEYRATRVKGGHVILARRGIPHVPIADLMHRTLKANGFTDVIEDGKVTGSRNNLTLRLNAEGPPASLDLSMPVNAQLIENVYAAPNAMSTMEMALYFPRDPKEFTPEVEQFEMQVNYETTEDRARFLVHQAVSMLLKNGQWTTDGLPEGFADAGMPLNVGIHVSNLDDGASVEFVRSAEKVSVTYRLMTDRAK